MKKTFLFLCVALLCATHILAYNAQIDGVYYNLNHVNLTAQVTYGDVNYSGDVTIPQTLLYEGRQYTVTSIGYQAFSNASWDLLKSLSLPETIEEIESEAFAYMGIGLKLTIPKNVKKLGHNVFGWNRCDTIIFNAKCVKDFDQLWYDCSTKVIIIGSDVDTIPTNMFAELGSLEEVEMHENVKYVGLNAINRSRLKNPVYNSKMLVAIPKDYNTNYTILPTTEKICAYAFADCSALPSVTMSSALTELGECAFRNCGSMYSINLPSSLESIGNNAFDGCSSLALVSIPENVKEIGYSAFANCPNLTSVIWNAINAKINYYYYDYRIFENQVENIVFGTKVQKIPAYLCCGLSQLTSISFPNSITHIGYRAFRDCTGLLAISLPNSLTTLEEEAFSTCTSLQSIQMGNNIETISTHVFDNCFNLSSINLPEGLKYIGEGAFRSCTSLTSIIIPQTVVNISNYAFEKDSSLADVYVETLTPSIMGYSVFTSNPTIHLVCGADYSAYKSASYWKNYNLTYPDPNFKLTFSTDTIGFVNILSENTCDNDTVIFEAQSKSIRYAFVRWDDENTENPRTLTLTKDLTLTPIFTKLDTIKGVCGDSLTWMFVDGILTIEGKGAMFDYSYYVYGPWNEISAEIDSISLPQGLTTIGKYAFYGCSNLTLVTIPNSVTTIGSNAFSSCSSLKTVYNISNLNIVKGSTSYGYVAYYADKVYNGIPTGDFIIKQNTIVTAYIGSATDVVIPDGITAIGNYAFDGCSNLTSVTIPNSVTTIGDYAFYNCSGLTSITIPNSVTTIGKYAFLNCSGLASITIPDSVTTIGEWAFDGCSGLTSVEAPAIFFDIQEDYFPYYTKQLQDIVVTGGELTENELLFLNRSYKTLKTLDVSAATNTTLADEAFKGCYNLETLLLPSQLEYIPYMAVAGCKNLKSIDIPASVVEIEQSAFEDCRSIQTITFGGAPANSSARMATNKTSQLKKIGNWAFYNAHELQYLDIPEGVEEIGDAAFYGCTYLQDLTLPSSVRTIGDNCFALCSKLQQVTVSATTPPSICARTFYNVNRAIPVYVPNEAINSYKSDIYWKEFDIQGGTTDLYTLPYNEKVGLGSSTKIIKDNQFYIFRSDKIYNAAGQKVR